MSRFTSRGRLNPMHKGAEGKKVITHGVANRLLQWAQTRVDEGFTEKEAAYFTGVFNAGDVVKQLEKDRHRFTRVNEANGNGPTVTRFYLEVRK